MTRPTMVEVLMVIASTMAQRSTCSRAHVGTVVARDGRLLSSGYNGAPAGMPHCEHPPSASDTVESCGVSVHAEANAIAFAARHGVPLAGAELVTTMAPCRKCAELIINAGLRTVTYAEAYRDTVGLDLLRAAGITVLAYAQEVHS